MGIRAGRVRRRISPSINTRGWETPLVHHDPHQETGSEEPSRHRGASTPVRSYPQVVPFSHVWRGPAFPGGKGTPASVVTLVRSGYDQGTRRESPAQDSHVGRASLVRLSHPGFGVWSSVVMWSTVECGWYTALTLRRCL